MIGIGMAKPEIPPALLRDEFVLLAPLRPDEIEMLRLWRNRDDVRLWFNDSSLVSAEQQAQWYIKYRKKPDDIVFVTRRATDLAPIGAVSLYRIDRSAGRAEFGRLMIGVPAARRGGYGFRSTVRLCAAAFASLELAEIVLEVKQENDGARRIYDRIGFRSITPPTAPRIEMTLTRAAFFTRFGP
ncbi:MAG: GNAT family N-acetyltransferase [Rhodospirillaceae bacterium]|nr:GNAT family N-acetyltransferase [Rhodospirillaceae bacterium]